MLSYEDYMAGQALTALLLEHKKKLVKYVDDEKEMCREAYRVAKLMAYVRDKD